MTPHPELADLALYSGRDLPLLQRWSVGRHLRQCPACRVEVAAFRSLAAAPIADNFIPHITWEPLAQEMRANIRLGLEASEAIAAYRRPTPSEERWLNWRAAAMVAFLMAVIGSGWWFAVSAKKLDQPLAKVVQPVPALKSRTVISRWNCGPPPPASPSFPSPPKALPKPATQTPKPAKSR